jgi:hypothetical protein
VRAGDSLTRAITLRFSTDSIPASTGSVVLEHNLGNALYLQWAEATGDSWRLSATLTAKPGVELAGGRVIIRFSQEALPVLTIPVQGVTEQ